MNVVNMCIYASAFSYHLRRTSGSPSRSAQLLSSFSTKAVFSFIVISLVLEICKLAEITKPTFYYHFRDKYDLVAWIFFYSHFNVDVMSIESAAESMNQVRNDFIFYKRAFEDSSQNALWQYMVDYFTERYEAEARKILDTEVLDAQTHFAIRLYCHGAVGMTREWLLSDNITSAETIVRMMFASMPAPLKS